MADVLTIPEVAARLRVAPTTVYALIARDYRPLPAAKCGKQYRVREAELWAWFEEEENTKGTTCRTITRTF